MDPDDILISPPEIRCYALRLYLYFVLLLNNTSAGYIYRMDKTLLCTVRLLSCHGANECRQIQIQILINADMAALSLWRRELSCSYRYLSIDG